MKRILKMVILQRTVESVDTAKKLATLNVKNEDIYLPLRSMKLPTGVTNLLDSSTACDVMKDDFRRQCQIILVALVLKFQERNPLSYCIVKNADSSPSMMVASRETAVTCFEYTVTKMSKLKAITPKVADNAKVECDNFLINDVNSIGTNFHHLII